MMNEMCPSWESVFKNIIGFIVLEENWDGNGSIPPSFEVIEFSLYLIQEIQETYSAPLRVIAGVNGTILLEFSSTEHIEISNNIAEVYKNGKLVDKYYNFGKEK